MARTAEYINPRAGGDAPAIAGLRDWFLNDCYVKKVPGVITGLRQDVHPLYRDAWEATETDHEVPRREWWGFEPSFWPQGPTHYPRIAPLGDALAAWQARYNLHDEWALQAALWNAIRREARSRLAELDAAPADGWPGEWTEEAEILRVASAGYPFPRHDGRAYITQVGDGWGEGVRAGEGGKRWLLRRLSQPGRSGQLRPSWRSWRINLRRVSP